MSGLTTSKQIADLFIYKNNKLYWRNRVNSNVAAGAEAGTVSPLGYVKICYKRQIYYAHRLIFLLVNGFLPDEVDHIDGNPNNNKITNLRAAQRHENCQNTRKRKDNVSGIKNVCWFKPRGKWKVELQVNKKRVHIGYYENITDAAKAATIARNKYHGDFARDA